MLNRIKNYKVFILNQVTKMLMRENYLSQMKSTREKYYVACFLKIANKKEFDILNHRTDNNKTINCGLCYNAHQVYVMSHLDEIVSNQKYFKKYLEKELEK